MKYFSPAILDGSVTTVKLADNAVTLPKMADDSVNTDELIGGAVNRGRIAAAITSLAGSIPLLSSVDLLVNAYAFWPMLHGESSIRVGGHSVDGVGADNSRFALHNVSLIAANTYDVDYRNITT